LEGVLRSSLPEVQMTSSLLRSHSLGLSLSQLFCRSIATSAEISHRPSGDCEISRTSPDLVTDLLSTVRSSGTCNQKMENLLELSQCTVEFDYSYTIALCECFIMNICFILILLTVNICFILILLTIFITILSYLEINKIISSFFRNYFWKLWHKGD
jgi:hypothetical protein